MLEKLEDIRRKYEDLKARLADPAFVQEVRAWFARMSDSNSSERRGWSLRHAASAMLRAMDGWVCFTRACTEPKFSRSLKAALHVGFAACVAFGATAADAAVLSGADDIGGASDGIDSTGNSVLHLEQFLAA